MVLKGIRLKNFRNFDEAEFTFSPELTLIVGENARGKTNLLEAIYFSIFGVGFRESREIELVKFVSKGEAQVEAAFEEKDLKHRFKIVLQVKGDLLQKTYMVANTKRMHSAYRKEQTRAVLFTPQQIEMLTGSPALRRDYFNRLLSSYDIEYKKRLDSYESGIRKRNKILEKHSSSSQLESELLFWDTHLEEHATFITQKRSEYVTFLNFHKTIDSKTFEIHYKKNTFTRSRAIEYFHKESLVRRTLIGPQKDEFQMYMEDEAGVKDVHRFGSRSEQRLTILWLKLNEITYHEEQTGKEPILLFDDIFSELDGKNKKLVIDLVTKYQTVATTTEKEIEDLASQKHKTISI